jgi:mannose-6-phosphate isomerase-like protein (cupin superfamily)
MSHPVPLDFSSTYLRLRADASIEPLAVDNTLWQRITSGQLGNFHGEFLIASGTCDADWPMWEMHPNGDEIVCLLSGSVTFLLQEAHGVHTVELGNCGEYVVVRKGTWHTARTRGPCRILFVTPGEGTQHRRISTPP